MNVIAKLDGKVVVPCEDMMEWGPWFEKADRKVAKDVVGDVRVSTVFLGLDHGWGGEPLWFETMVFGGKLDQERERYETWEQAEAGHAAMLKRVREAEGAEDQERGEV